MLITRAVPSPAMMVVAESAPCKVMFLAMVNVSLYTPAPICTVSPELRAWLMACWMVAQGVASIWQLLPVSLPVVAT